MFFVIFWTVLVRYTWLSNSSRFFFPTIGTFGWFWSQWPTSLAVTSGCPTMRCGRLPSRSDVNIQQVALVSEGPPNCPFLPARHLLSIWIIAVIFWALRLMAGMGSSPPNLGTTRHFSLPSLPSPPVPLVPPVFFVNVFSGRAQPRNLSIWDISFSVEARMPRRWDSWTAPAILQDWNRS